MKELKIVELWGMFHIVTPSVYRYETFKTLPDGEVTKEKIINEQPTEYFVLQNIHDREVAEVALKALNEWQATGGEIRARGEFL
jgi:hypothetical protein